MDTTIESFSKPIQLRVVCVDAPASVAGELVEDRVDALRKGKSEMEKKRELQISRARRYTLPEGENGENQMECEAESEWLDEDVENIHDVGREQDDVVRDLVLENLGSIFSHEDPAFAVDL